MTSTPADKNFFSGTGDQQRLRCFVGGGSFDGTRQFPHRSDVQNVVRRPVYLDGHQTLGRTVVQGCKSSYVNLLACNDRSVIIRSGH